MAAGRSVWSSAIHIPAAAAAAGRHGKEQAWQYRQLYIFYVPGKNDRRTMRKRLTLALAGIRRNDEYLIIAEDNRPMFGRTFYFLMITLF